MRVMVYHEVAGVSEVTIVPGRALKLAPLTLRSTDKEWLREEVAVVIHTMKGGEVSPIPL